MSASTNTQLWPTTGDSPIDWEHVFESQDQGLIPLINKTKTRNGLRKSVRTIIHSMFQRKNDDKNRRKFEARLEELLPDGDAQSDPNIENEKRLLTELLREIKEECQRMAAEAAAARIDADEHASRVFAEVCSNVVQTYFDALQGGIDPDLVTPLPFILSPTFAEHFKDALRRYIIPGLTTRCRGLILRTGHQPAARRREFLENLLQDRKEGPALRDFLGDGWRTLTSHQQLPPKPDEKGLFGNNQEPGQLSLEEWQAEVVEIEKANALSEKFWSEIFQPSDAYLPPTDDDRDMLGSPLAKLPVRITKKITAIRQMVEQADENSSIGRTFDNYRQHRDVDLALLSVAHQRPDLLLGEGDMLKVLLKGCQDQERQVSFPLVLRYMSEHL